MAVSSVTKNFVISGQRQAEMFVDAIEASVNENRGNMTARKFYILATVTGRYKPPVTQKEEKRKEGKKKE